MLRNGVLLAILANALIGVSLVWDKVLLRRPATRSVANYVFWLGAMSILGLALMPFGFHMPAAGAALLGFGAGIIHLIANFFYYQALKAGEASHTLAIMGGLSPTATVLIALALVKQPLGGHGLTGFVLMVAGGFVMFLAERIAWRKILAPVLFSAAFFGLTNVLQKLVFEETGFITGYVFFTLGTFAGSMLLLVRGAWRRQIFRQSKEAPPRSRFWYFVNRFVSGAGSFLIFAAISRASPAVVDAISGLRYAIIFVGAWLITSYRPLWLREEFKGWTLIAKAAGTVLVVAGLVVVGIEGEADVAALERQNFFAQRIEIDAPPLHIADISEVRCLRRAMADQYVPVRQFAAAHAFEKIVHVIEIEV
jgi:drug/metabolite transporter (DMT)-like permease